MSTYNEIWGSSRQERGERILMEGKVYLVRETRRKDYFEVESQTQFLGIYYNVVLSGDDAVCECKDHLYRNPTCKHIRACRMYKDLY